MAIAYGCFPGFAPFIEAVDREDAAALQAYIKSQAHEGWRLMRDRYDDGGFSGGSMERPALKKLLDAVRARRIDVIIVYKVDRLTRSLADFAKLVELFDEHQVSFVSVTQAFNTTTSMGRLTLNVLLSFAQFEREVTGERIRDKIAASKKKGIWMGGVVPLGYRVESRALYVVEDHAAFVRDLFRRYLECGSVVRLKTLLDQEKIRLPIRIDGRGKMTGGGLISRGHLYKILSSPIYVGRLTHKGQVHEGLHDPIVDHETWDRVQRLLAEHAHHRAGSRQDSDALLAGAAVPLSTERDHSGGRRATRCGAPDANQSARDPYRRVARRPSLARRTDDKFEPHDRIHFRPREEDRTLDPHDDVARLPFSGPRQGGDRRTAAAGLRHQAPDGPSDGLVGSVVRARSQGARAGLNES